MSSQHINNNAPSEAGGITGRNDNDSALNDPDSGNSSEEVTTRLLAPLSSVYDGAVEPAPSSADSFVFDETEASRANDLMTATLVHPLSLSSPMAPDGMTARPNSLSRRRGGGTNSNSNNNKREKAASRAPSLATTSSTATTNSSASLRQRNSNTGSRSETIDEEANAGGLRNSLDAGMARVRRWIRSRSAATVATSHGASTPSWTTSSSPLRLRHTEEPCRRNPEDDYLIDLSREDIMNSSTSSVVDDFATPQHRSSSQRTNRLAPPTIMEETEDLQAYHSLRQRALSEPDAVRIRDFLFQRALSAPQRGFRRRRYPSVRQPRQPRGQRTRGNSIELTAGGAVSASSQLSSSAAEVLYAPTRSLRSATDHSNELPADADGGAEISTVDASAQDESGATESATQTESDHDSQREARVRWICINRRFQVVITIVALVFSLLLFAILVCWVVLTSAYVVSIDKSCDVPLKAYFWLVTLQLILDVFRSDIMRLFFRWDANSNQRIPCRVITYNIGYLTYALLVLRLGIYSVFLEDETTCRRTAPELFQSSAAFVSLSIAAWSTIVLGYLVPFCFVATLLTLNGYTPSSDNQRDGSPPFTVFPTSMGAPPGCVDELRIVMLEEFPADYPMECCICMENFTGAEVIVETECNHVFHKQCCREWLRQARTCPVCRMDIPTALENAEDPDQANQPQESRGRLGFGPASRPFARNDLHHEVVSLLQILRRRDRRQLSRGTVLVPSEVSRSDEVRDGSRDPSIPVSLHEIPSSLEEGRSVRQFPQP
jgi:hypothetical protein